MPESGIPGPHHPPVANKANLKLRLPDAPKPNRQPVLLRPVPIPRIPLGDFRLHQLVPGPLLPISLPRPVQAHRRPQPPPSLILPHALLIDAPTKIHVRQSLLRPRLRHRLSPPKEARIHAETTEWQIR